jgi:hypothetical protein
MAIRCTAGSRIVKMLAMKQPLALRIDAGVLEQVRRRAINENRTMLS